VGTVTIENLYKLTPELKNAIGRHPAAAPQPTEQAARAPEPVTGPHRVGEETSVGKTGSRLRCSTCQYDSAHVATIERHCHAARHLRYDWVWR
jgi:hypothetical protein